MSPFKSLEYRATAGLITSAIDRSPRNVLDIARMAEIGRAVDAAARDETARVPMIAAAGDRIFSAGVDVTAYTPDKGVHMIDAFHGPLKQELTCPVPTIAALGTVRYPVGPRRTPVFKS